MKREDRDRRGGNRMGAASQVLPRLPASPRALQRRHSPGLLPWGEERPAGSVQRACGATCVPVQQRPRTGAQASLFWGEGGVRKSDAQRDRWHFLRPSS